MRTCFKKGSEPLKHVLSHGLLALLAITVWACQLHAQAIVDNANNRILTTSLKTIHVSGSAWLPDLLQHWEEPLPIVSAHRGGPMLGFPENCIATFQHTLQHTFAMLEVDPRYTKDGEIVLHHDARLERTTTGTGMLADYTLAELQNLRLKDPQGNATNQSIATLDEAILWAQGKAILVLDQKDIPAEVRVKKITEHHAERYAMVIVYSFKDAEKCYALNKQIMMEVMIPNHEQLRLFDETGIPWRNVIAFIGHNPPTDPTLLKELQSRGVLCMVGTSRNLDKQVLGGETPNIRNLQDEYQRLISFGVDLIETDIPTQLGPLLFNGDQVTGSRGHFFGTLRL